MYIPAAEVKEKRACLSAIDRSLTANVMPDEPSSADTIPVEVSSNSNVFEPSSHIVSPNEGTKKRRPRTAAAQTAQSKQKHALLPSSGVASMKQMEQLLPPERQGPLM